MCSGGSGEPGCGCVAELDEGDGESRDDRVVDRFGVGGRRRYMWARSNRIGNALIMIRWAVSWSDDGFSSRATEGGGRLRLPYVGIRRLTSFEIALTGREWKE